MFGEVRGGFWKDLGVKTRGPNQKPLKTYISVFFLKFFWVFGGGFWKDLGVKTRGPNAENR